jgi:hypothetical protein
MSEEAVAALRTTILELQRERDAAQCAAGTQFTCFTRTYVQILAQKVGKETARESEEAVAALVAALRTTILELQRESAATGASITCFTSTNVQILTRERAGESQRRGLQRCAPRFWSSTTKVQTLTLHTLTRN